MSSDTKLSFIYGAIAGAGAVLALMSYGFLQFVGPLENIGGVTTTELRIAMILGGIVCAFAIAYEFYGKKDSKTKSENKESPKEKVVEESENQNIKSSEESEKSKV